MAQQIICLEKNKADFSYDSVVLTASQGPGHGDFRPGPQQLDGLGDDRLRGCG
jgi:hypothetical protein